MPCIEAQCPRPARRGRAGLAVAAVAATLLLAGCGSSVPPPAVPSAPAPVSTAEPAVSPAPSTGRENASPGSPPAPRQVSLPAPATPRTLLELQRQVAHRLVQAHPDGSYLGPAPDRLMAIPVLEIELNANGTVRRIVVLRHPKTGSQATQLAIDAVHRAAPYGNVSQLPRPWKVVETFLFDDTLRFKPRILDLP